MVFEQKEFTQINGYTNYYICKETSEVLSTKERQNTTKGTTKLLKPVNNSKNPSNNYYIVTLVDDSGIRRNRPIHRLMCETFLPNPDNKKHVNHIDGDKLNNTLSNLEWATEQENTQHAVDTGLMTHDHCKKMIYQYDLATLALLNTFESDREATRVTGIPFQNISKVTRGLRKSAGGFFWSRTELTPLVPTESDFCSKPLEFGETLEQAIPSEALC